MSEIKKMYKNAKVKPICDGLDCFTCTAKCNNGKYPEFTAEKQLELIKFLFNHNVYYDVDTKGNYWFHISDDCYTYYYNKFEIALANIINEMWQDLTETEQAQIRSILNG